MKLVFKIIVIHYEKFKKELLRKYYECSYWLDICNGILRQPLFITGSKDMFDSLSRTWLYYRISKINNDFTNRIKKYISSRPVILGIKD